MRSILSLKSISFVYSGSQRVIFQDADFELYDGDKVGLVGPNGCGKTTFLHICIGILKPTKGNILFYNRLINSDKDLFELRKHVGFVFQNPDDQLFSPTVLEDVAFGPLNLGLDRHKAERKARNALELVGLKGFEDRITHKLSGGEKRLVSLATVLAMEPKALLLDEPSTGLDPETRNRIIDLLNKLDISLLIVSHDWDFIVRTTSIYYTIENYKIIKIDKSILHQHMHYHPAGNIPHEHL